MTQPLCLLVTNRNWAGIAKAHVVAAVSAALNVTRELRLCGSTEHRASQLPRAAITDRADRRSRRSDLMFCGNNRWNLGVHDNVASGYWQKPQQREQTLGATFVAPSVEHPEKPWLRT
jgi:hypothetical protein